MRNPFFAIGGESRLTNLLSLTRKVPKMIGSDGERPFHRAPLPYPACCFRLNTRRRKQGRKADLEHNLYVSDSPMRSPRRFDLNWRCGLH